MTDQAKDIWKDLRKPFPREVIGSKPQGGRQIDFVGHAAVTDRLNTVVGPDGWNWEPLSVDEAGMPRLDGKGNLWIKLTVRDVTKLGYGDGSTSIKELIGDAIRNAAMRFGVALDLWSKEDLESTLADPGMKNERASTGSVVRDTRPAVGSTKPSTPPVANTDLGQPISNAQGAMILGMAKKASGLATREDVLDFIEMEAGVKLTEIKQRDLARVKAVFGVDAEAA